MTSNGSITSPDVIALTADIVSAYVGQNSVPRTELPAVIQSVHAALVALNAPPEEVSEEAKPKPAVPVKKSVTPDYLVSLEDGRKLKSLKRYLAAKGMTPQEYREKWNLPPDYPMVAPNYAKRRSELAKNMGLGRLAGQARQEAAAATRTLIATVQAALPAGEVVSLPKSRRRSSRKEIEA
jgi:predicted transcriptional regulator